MFWKILYQNLWKIAPFLLRFYLRRRSHKQSAYAENWHERFGVPFAGAVQGAIWIHAVSVGETRAAAPLIAKLQYYFPDAPLLITQMTPTGRATAQSLYPDAQVRYLPYDRKEWVRQFVTEHRPLFGIIMETEIWPNLLDVCQQEGVAVFLANARLSEKSAAGYDKIRSLIAPALQKLSGCYAQSEADASRLQTLGASNLQVMGNTKYDITPPESAQKLAEAFRKRVGKRSVFLAASTRHRGNEDEAEKILSAFASSFAKMENAPLLVVVPRHPERFQLVFEYAQKLGLCVQKRSDDRAVDENTQVWIGDSMGEMFAYYQLADVVFVGGSLVDTGCQNIIEPLSCKKPVLFGFSTYNFQAACENALAQGVAVQVQSAEHLMETMQQWLKNPIQYQSLQENTQRFIQKHQGASEKIALDVAEKVKHSLCFKD